MSYANKDRCWSIVIAVLIDCSITIKFGFDSYSITVKPDMISGCADFFVNIQVHGIEAYQPNVLFYFLQLPVLFCRCPILQNSTAEIHEISQTVLLLLIVSFQQDQTAEKVPMLLIKGGSYVTDQGWFLYYC